MKAFSGFLSIIALGYGFFMATPQVLAAEPAQASKQELPATYDEMYNRAIKHDPDLGKVITDMIATMGPAPKNKDERAIWDEYFDSVVAYMIYDNKRMMQIFDKDLRQYDMWDGATETYASLDAKWANLNKIVAKTTKSLFVNFNIKILSDNYAYVSFEQPFSFVLTDGTPRDFVGRVTDLWFKRDGRWGVIDEHFSVPVDFHTGKANWTSAPSKPSEWLKKDSEGAANQ